MSSSEAPGFTPELNVQEVLTQELGLWCLRHIAASELNVPTATNEPPYIIFEGPDLIEPCAEQITFYGNALDEASDRDHELGDADSAKLHILPNYNRAYRQYWKTYRYPTILEVKEDEGPLQRDLYDRSIYAAKRASGQPHVSPIGFEWAVAIARGEISLPADPEVVKILDMYLAMTRPELYLIYLRKAEEN